MADKDHGPPGCGEDDRVFAKESFAGASAEAERAISVVPFTALWTKRLTLKGTLERGTCSGNGRCFLCVHHLCVASLTQRVNQRPRGVGRNDRKSTVWGRLSGRLVGRSNRRRRGGLIHSDELVCSLRLPGTGSIQSPR